MRKMRLLFSRWIGSILFFFRRIINYFIRIYTTSKMSKVGNNVYIGQNGIFTYDNIEIGDDVYIASNCVFQSLFGKIIIGNHVMFGPGVNIHGGNHKVDEVGKLLKHTSDKKMGDDGIVTIENDCWIGANSIILSNVTIGKGSVIGAGSVVTKDIPPYSIYVGNHQSLLRQRFTGDNLKKHICAMETQDK